MIAATNHDLRAAIADKRFREDLYWHACMMTLGDTIDVQDFPPYLVTTGQIGSEPAESALTTEPESATGTLEQHERALILRAMHAAGGNQSEAARTLRIGRDALRYKLKKHNL